MMISKIVEWYYRVRIIWKIICLARANARLENLRNKNAEIKRQIKLYERE